jgi:hypothetical protein
LFSAVSTFNIARIAPSLRCSDMYALTRTHLLLPLLYMSLQIRNLVRKLCISVSKSSSFVSSRKFCASSAEFYVQLCVHSPQLRSQLLVALLLSLVTLFLFHPHFPDVLCRRTFLSRSHKTLALCQVLTSTLGTTGDRLQCCLKSNPKLGLDTSAAFIVCVLRSVPPLKQTLRVGNMSQAQSNPKGR